MIILTNAVAYGIEGLIYAPFGGAENMGAEQILSMSTGGSQLGAFAAIAAGATAVGAAFAVGGVLATAGMVLLGVLIALALLAFRQVVIVALLLISPLAIVAWILPGTEKWWKMWWESFSKLLLLYPIIIGFLATGRALATIVQKVDPDSGATGALDSILKFILVIICIFGPFYLIPKTFQLAGGVFQTLTGTINNTSKGAFDRLRNRRKQTMAKTWDATKTGNRFKNGNPTNFRGKMNKTLMGATMAGKAGINPTNWRTNMKTAMQERTEMGVEDAEKNGAFQMISGDDAKLWAAKGTSRGDIEKRLLEADKDRFYGEGNAARREEAISQIMRAQKEIGHDQFQKARLRAQAKTGTGYQDAEGNFDAALMLKDINDTYGDDRNGAAKALAEMRGSLTNSGQIAGQAGFSTWATQLEAANNGASAIDTHNAIMDDTIDSVPPGYAIHGKPGSAAALGAAHNRRIQKLAKSINSGEEIIDTGKKDAQGKAIMRAATMDDLSVAVANAAGIADAMGQASPQNASAFVNELYDKSVVLRDDKLREAGMGVATVGPPPPGSTPITTQTVRDLVDSSMGGNSQFVMRRTTMESRSLAQSQQYMQQQRIQGGAQGLPPGPGNTPGMTP